MVNAIPKSEWQWFGNAGHFCCGQWCRFHITTLVGKWLVSTIGEYINPKNAEGSELSEYEWILQNWPGENIGYNRKYETMVFLAGTPCSEDGCKCGLPGIGSHEVDDRGYNDAGSAARGHMDMCEQWAALQDADAEKESSW